MILTRSDRLLPEAHGCSRATVLNEETRGLGQQS